MFGKIFAILILTAAGFAATDEVALFGRGKDCDADYDAATDKCEKTEDECVKNAKEKKAACKKITDKAKRKKCYEEAKATRKACDDKADTCEQKAKAKRDKCKNRPQ